MCTYNTLERLLERPPQAWLISNPFALAAAEKDGARRINDRATPGCDECATSGLQCDDCYHEDLGGEATCAPPWVRRRDEILLAEFNAQGGTCAAVDHVLLAEGIGQLTTTC